VAASTGSSSLARTKRKSVEPHEVGHHGARPSRTSIEVDNVDDVYERARNAGAEIVYPITDEDWGLGRFFVRDRD
jgi:uncharacterized glyoxalase superfamily protein PhnB